MRRMLPWSLPDSLRGIAAILLWSGLILPAVAQSVGPAYELRFADRANHVLEVTATFAGPAADSLELMLPIWSPGFYMVQDYARNVSNLTASTAAGATLTVEQPRGNRWRISAAGSDAVVVRYQLKCDEHFVTTNYVGEDFAALTGCSTFIVPLSARNQPCTVTVELPDDWSGCAAGLPNRSLSPRRTEFTAENYDVLVDSPIVAGNLREQVFQVGPCRHVWVDVGDWGTWQLSQSAHDAERIATATQQFWGELPYDRYYFLNVFRPGQGGGLEHAFSTLLTANSRQPQDTWGWRSFVSHEYFHTVNVKRLRPLGLGPFDYEQPPRTPSLWISEGLTTYFGDLLVVRGGLGTPEEFLAAMSRMIRQLQNNPGRLKQSLTDASWNVWTNSRSGVTQGSDTVSYYVKGPVVGLLLDAKIREASHNTRSLDDVMRAAFREYSGEHGFSEAQFRALASATAGVDLSEWFAAALDQPVELDYRPLLDWYGLEFIGGEDPRAAWELRVAPQATAAQRAQLASLFAAKPRGENQ